MESQQGPEQGREAGWSNRRRFWRGWAVGVGVVFGAILIVFFPRDSIRQRIEESARDVAVLAYAVNGKSTDFGPMPPFPDAAYASVESRKRYGIPADMPQDLVDALGRFGPGDPPIYQALTNTPWEHSAPFFQQRLRQWNCLRWPVDYLSAAEIAVERNLSEIEVSAELRRRADQKGPIAWFRRRFHRPRIPTDPFAAKGSDGLYRYGRPSIESPQKFQYCLWVVAGNGPDRDADLDAARFNPRPIDPDWVSGRSFRIDFRLGCNPLDLVYDPTNGLVSDGDILLMPEIFGVPDVLSSSSLLLERLRFE